MLNLYIGSTVHAQNAGLFISPGYGIHPDRTIDSFELIFVRKGTLAIEEEGARFDLEPGQTLILWPGRRHRGAAPYSPEVSFYWIHFQLRARNPRRERANVSLPQVVTPARPERIVELFRQYISDAEEEALTAEQAALLMTLMLLEVGRPKLALPGGKPSGAVTLAANYIAENFHRGIGAGDVARALRLHPDYLGRIFHRSFGHTITEAIHHRQIREARELLRESGFNIDEIAGMCGFADARYFRRVFSESQGVSPLKFRQQQRRLHINTI